jgi:hypothetical protein
MAPELSQSLTEKRNRNLPGVKRLPARKADNLTAICELMVETKFGILDFSQPYGPPRPVTGIALSLQISVAAPSKAQTVFALSNTGIVGSNLTRSMDVCVFLFYVSVVLCVGNSLETG